VSDRTGCARDLVRLASVRAAREVKHELKHHHSIREAAALRVPCNRVDRTLDVFREMRKAVQIWRTRLHPYGRTDHYLAAD
jgi:hypothetical protein